jgi:hypothetical protein
MPCGLPKRGLNVHLRGAHPPTSLTRSASAKPTSNGFGDIPMQRRNDIMWLAQEWDAALHSLEGSPDLSHPVNIRQAYREWVRGYGPQSTC